MALNFELRRKAHAIGEFTATLAFSRPVSGLAFAKVIDRLKEVALRLDLPAQMNVSVLNISVGPKPESFPPSGLGFQRFASNGEIECSLWCDPDNINFTLRNYDRWQTVLPKILDALEHIIPGYMTEVPAVRAFQVQYLNEFASKDLAEGVVSEVFRAGNQWVAPFSYSCVQPWHCHVGQFINSDVQSRFLININCDVMPNPWPINDLTRNYVRVLILASRLYDLPERGPLIISLENLSVVLRENFNAVHSLEKKILGEIISNEYLDQMGEGARDY